ncbi:MAG: CDP-archaeol synthase [Deltaproteobacteria bacterium]|nr:CDP-archaeol synthase [Deltaproteobacteria bacterium]
MLEATCQLLYLGSPLFLAAPVQGLTMKYDWLTFLKKPMDMGFSIRGKRVFGDHKTWRGATIQIIFCLVGALLQMDLQNAGFIPSWVPLLDYHKHALVNGLLLGIGSTLGELPNSFLKRQIGIAPGMKGRNALKFIFFLFDQVDLALGIWIFLFFLIKPSFCLIAYSLLLTIVLHVSVSSVGYLLGMRKTIV